MIRIDGRTIAQEVINELRKRPVPAASLAALVVGDDPSSLAFLRQKEKTASVLMVRFQLVALPANSSQEAVEAKLAALADDSDVGGIVVQLPLPSQLDQVRIISKIPAEKDVDALTSKAQESGVMAPAARVVERILQEQFGSVAKACAGKVVAIVGRGLLVGDPVRRWLAGQGITAEVAHRGTTDLCDFLQHADIIISGVGKKGLITTRCVKAGAGVIDFGVPADLDPEGLAEAGIGFYTPTPGGTGPILVAALLENFYRLNK